MVQNEILRQQQLQQLRQVGQSSSCPRQVSSRFGSADGQGYENQQKSTAAGCGPQLGATQLYDEQGRPIEGSERWGCCGSALQNEGSLQLGARSSEQPGNAGVGSSSGGGNSAATALTGGSERFAAKNDVVLSAPDIDWGYAVIERQDDKTLTTSLIPFNLGKIVLDGDASQDLELLPGDVVTIFSKADIRVPSTQQTRYVRLEGEVDAGGLCTAMQPGETLRQPAARALEG